MFNLIVVIGRLGKDPELTYTANGKEITKFSLATDHGFGENRETTWHNVVCFGKTAEAVARYCKKGSLVAVQGRQQHRSYEKKDGSRGYFSEVVAERVQFIDTRGQEEGHDTPVRDVSQGDINPDSLPF